MSEIRKALELMKRVEAVEDAPARRLALELGALACDRGEAAARRAQSPEQVCHGGGGDGGGGGGDGGGGRGDGGRGGGGGGGGGCSSGSDLAMTVPSLRGRDRGGLRLGVVGTNQPFVAPYQGARAGEAVKFEFCVCFSRRWGDGELHRS